MDPQKQTSGAAESGINIPIKAHTAVACVFTLSALSNAGAHKVNFSPQKVWTTLGSTTHNFKILNI